MAEIILTKSHIAIVDECDFLRLWMLASWSFQNTGYAGARINNRLVLMHQLIAEWSMGVSELFVEHENRNKLDNRRDNLRYADQSDNLMNASVRMDNSSGFRGVYWHAKAGKWMAQMQYRGTLYYLGLHAHVIDAAKAYDQKALELAGPFARLNFP